MNHRQPEHRFDCGESGTSVKEVHHPVTNRPVRRTTVCRICGGSGSC